jgi:hypothetical protein
MLANVVVVLITKPVGYDKLMSDLGESAAIPVVDATAQSGWSIKTPSVVSPGKTDGIVSSVAHIDFFNIFIF